MTVLDKLKRLSKKKRFDDLPDMRNDESLDDIDLRQMADNCAERIMADAKANGFDNLEVKLVGVGVYLMVLDPTDESRNKMVLSPMVVAHKDIGFEEMMSASALLKDTDASKMMNNEEQEYKPDKARYEGHMYG
jgi:hypothetical protein